MAEDIAPMPETPGVTTTAIERLGIDPPQLLTPKRPATVIAWSVQSAQLTLRRVIDFARLIDQADRASGDIAHLRRSAEFIAENLAELSKKAAGIDRNSAEITREVTGLTKAAQGIDTQAERLSGEIASISQIMPTLQRLTDIVDPLDNTVARLGRFVDRLPGNKRASAHNREPQ